MPNLFNSYPYPQQYGYQMPQNQPMIQQMNQPMNQPTPQIQNGGFLSAPSEEYARNYPVGLGNSVTFKDENAPFVYTKTMGFSQLESPRFEKYRLVKESPAETAETPQKEKVDIEAIISSIDKANDQIEAIWAEIDKLKNAKEKSDRRTGYSKRDKDGDDRYDE